MNLIFRRWLLLAAVLLPVSLGGCTESELSDSGLSDLSLSDSDASDSGLLGSEHANTAASTLGDKNWQGGAAEAASLPAPEETLNTALIMGDRAQQTAQTAQSITDWELTASRWEQALNLLKAIPADSAVYGEAQNTIQTYDAQLQEARGQLAARRG